MKEADDIIQLLPADGWRVRTINEDGTMTTAPIVAWALLRNGEVQALDADSSGRATYGECANCEIYHPDTIVETSQPFTREELEAAFMRVYGVRFRG